MKKPRILIVESDAAASRQCQKALAALGAPEFDTVAQADERLNGCAAILSIWSLSTPTRKRRPISTCSRRFGSSTPSYR